MALKRLNHNTRCYFYSNARYCDRCSETNTYFFRHKYVYKGKVGFSERNICRQCYNETRTQSKQTAEYAKEYRKKNLEKKREQSRVCAAKIRMRKKLIKLREENFNKVLI